MKKWKSFLKQGLKWVFILALLRGIVWACGGGPGYWDIEPSVYFSPNISDTSKKYELFYFTPYLLNTPHNEYGYSEEPAPAKNQYDENIEVWYTRLKQAIPKNEIDSFLYGSPEFRYTSTTTQKDFIKQYSTYALISHLQKKGKKAELTYLYTAKRNEFGAHRLELGWESFDTYDHYGTEAIGTSERKDNIANVIAYQLTKEKDDFFRRRYAFQLIRNYRYNMRNQETDSLFTRYFVTGAKDYLYYEALNYTCDAMVNDAQLGKANYYASVLFANYEPKRIRAYQNFTRKNPIEESLIIAPNAHEKSNVYTLYAFRDYQPNAIYIKEAVKLDEHNELIDQLITREINKMDRKLLPKENRISETSGEEQYNEDAGEALYDDDGDVLFMYPDIKANYTILRELLNELVLLKNSKKDFYKLCLAHLQVQMNEYPEAQRTLNEIKPNTLNNYLTTQFYLTSTILFIKSRNLRDAQNREMLSAKLTMLERYEKFLYNPAYIHNGVSLLMMEKFVQEKDFARAFLVSRALPEQYENYDILDRYARPKDIDTIISYLNAPGTNFDKHLKALYSRGTFQGNLRSIQGSLYLRQNDILNAHLSFKRLNEPFIAIDFKHLNTNPDGHPLNPFYYDTLTAEEKEYRTAEEIAEWNERAQNYALSYNNYSLTREMLGMMLAIAKKQGDPAQHYFNLACLQFEMTYHGRAFRAVNYLDRWGWNELDYLEYEKKLPIYYEDYYGCKKAMEYYKKSLGLSHNKELSAKCLYALFRCNRYWQKVYKEQNEGAEFPYLFELHDKYQATDYYKIKECWGLSAYVEELRGSGSKKN